MSRRDPPASYSGGCPLDRCTKCGELFVREYDTGHEHEPHPSRPIAGKRQIFAAYRYRTCPDCRAQFQKPDDVVPDVLEAIQQGLTMDDSVQP